MRTHAWIRVLVGWLIGTACLLHRPEPVPPAPAECSLEPARPARVLPTLREWRGLPGIGRRRALDLARALWAAGVADPRAFDPTSVHGIGAGTAATIAAYLEGG